MYPGNTPPVARCDAGSLQQGVVVEKQRLTWKEFQISGAVTIAEAAARPASCSAMSSVVSSTCKYMRGRVWTRWLCNAATDLTPSSAQYRAILL